MVDDEQQRPDPDSLLAVANEKPRGRLKVFFGACAGVGKTYAMLQEAQRQRALGLDVLVGVVETHGRNETAALLDGLSVLPQKRIQHRGRVVREFDLDAALARHPALILMDELAHSNAHGSRHPKRWQDVEELLDAGIDVLTTVNVQHLESLNDVVGGITGIRVRETVPDHVFDQATEVVLVDLPPDDLQRRLNEGKVYLPGHAERAIEHFFRKGNLIALRELALRRTADRVDDQMRAFRDTQGREKVWHTRDSILLCVGHNSGSEKLVRIAARLAARLGCHWHAVYVETPNCTGCRKPAAAPFCARCVWRRSWAQKPPRWPRRRKSARCCATPANITWAKSLSAGAASNAGSSAAASPTASASWGRISIW
ncbi:Sensor protein KdpD [Serratia rubidaea]|uniref:Sensor protein KdpD n=1 Tax=Serratia rubidaea TaxID=61652 RepID=A0A4U9HBJ3_SERRU|nr:Sensor protein KdpD [Serratia rubidaea]